MQKVKQTYYLSFLRIAFIIFLFLGMQFTGNASDKISVELSSQDQEIQHQSFSNISLFNVATGVQSQSFIYSSRSADHHSPFSFLIAVENEQNIENKKGEWAASYRAIGSLFPTVIKKSLYRKLGLGYIPLRKLSLILLSTVVFLH